MEQSNIVNYYIELGDKIIFGREQGFDTQKLESEMYMLGANLSSEEITQVNEILINRAK